MTIKAAANGNIQLEGICPIEDAEPFLSLLSANPRAAIDWRGCRQAHSAIIQLLLVIDPARLLGPPAGEILRTLIEPIVKAHKTAASFH